MRKNRGLLLRGLARSRRSAPASARAKNAPAAVPFVQLPSAEPKWSSSSGGPVESFVIGSKEAKHSPTSRLHQVQGGFDFGWHVHESDYEAVVLGGNDARDQQGAARSRSRSVPGLVTAQPMVVHRTQCVGPASASRTSTRAGDSASRPRPRTASRCPRQRAARAPQAAAANSCNSAGRRASCAKRPAKNDNGTCRNARTPARAGVQASRMRPSGRPSPRSVSFPRWAR